jgi:DNA-binding NtrC family response regulator/pSer/pThr/pTyr-binding forkhead associated (FHA) protein
MTDSAPESAPRTAFRLVVFSSSAVRTVPLHGDRWTLGRAEDCDICLRDQTVSRRHLVIERVGEEFRFRDLGSSNLALIDGKPMSEGRLLPGTTLMIGLCRITLDRREVRAKVIADNTTTVVVSRETLAEVPDRRAPVQVDARRLNIDAITHIVECLELPLADLGSSTDAAEPLLDLALNLTNRQRGALGLFPPTGHFQCLATLDRTEPERELRIHERVLSDARAAQAPFLISQQSRSEVIERVVIPFGPGPSGLLLLEKPGPDAPAGQDVLRLARALGNVAWQRLSEAEQRLRLRDEVAKLRYAGTSSHSAVLASSRLQQLRKQLREAATLRSPVMLIGEDGTERQELAHYLHAESPQAFGPFVTFHPAVLPAEHIEGELFGAGRNSGGALASAHGGTLYIDQPHMLPPQLQERLAEVLHDGRLEVGTGYSVPLTVRVVTSAPAEPGSNGTKALVPALAKLLAAIRLTIPPLRHEPRDAVAIAEQLLAELGPAADGQRRSLSDRSKQLLQEYPWPGNVRQLRTVIESAIARAGQGQILPRHLPDEVRDPDPSDLTGVPTLEELETKHIRSVLARVGGNRTRAATALGIAASTLYEKIKRYRLD